MAKAKRKDEPHENSSLVVLPPPPPRGRPDTYTDELATEICERIANGETLSRLCLDEDMPGRRTVTRWLMNREDFAAQYARAREMQALHEADEILDISDNVSEDAYVEYHPLTGQPYAKIDGFAAKRAQIMIDTRKWRAERLNRRVFGQKVEHEHIAGHPPAGQDVLPPGLGFLAGKLPSSDAA